MACTAPTGPLLLASGTSGSFAAIAHHFSYTYSNTVILARKHAAVSML